METTDKFKNFSAKCNDFFLPGKVSFLLDAWCAGSSGKGKIESFIIKNSNNCSGIITTNSANASHIVVENGVEYLFKCLPSGSLYHERLECVMIGPGASFEVETFFKEVKMCGIPLEKVFIHPKAMIINKIDIDFEKGLCDLDGNYFEIAGEGTIKHGSTCSGSGAVTAKKTIRHKTSIVASDIPELARFIAVTEDIIMDGMKLGKSYLCQIGQGFPLSLNHWRFKKNVTSRNVTVSAGLNDCMLPPSVVGNVLGNGRIYPIKIANYKQISRVEAIDQYKVSDFTNSEHCINIAKAKYRDNLFKCDFDESGENVLVTSLPNVHVTADDLDIFPDYPYDKIDSYSGDGYPDQQEISWEYIEETAGISIPNNIKRTSLTKLPRRCFTHSKIAFDEGIKYNMPPEGGEIWISLNFVNWIDSQMEGITDFVSQEVKLWIEQNLGQALNANPKVKLRFLGTGAETDHTITLER